MSTKTEEWVKCSTPEVSDTLRWNEPIWAPPTRARGKPDKMGEQRITATLLASGEFMEFEVLAVEKVSGGGKTRVQIGDQIRRKPSTLTLGNCYKKRQ